MKNLVILCLTKHLYFHSENDVTTLGLSDMKIIQTVQRNHRTKVIFLFRYYKK